ncbi:hypothetical protein E2562_012414 [Oryza meyeriana var. granulata]|uniref:Uncharacterized protein n=1 Tax=Oryza meyeriana var. granulata TaxID=110450 RepID=A0A6G1C5F4_9ORYZ|nr:hypothetical protein E2562_012414 [Oryza meyeriana var. granulata]
MEATTERARQPATLRPAPPFAPAPVAGERHHHSGETTVVLETMTMCFSLALQLAGADAADEEGGA